VRIDGLIWHQAVEDKLCSKHGVTRSEVEETFANGPRFRFVEGGDYAGEDVYAAFGRTDAGRYLTVFFIYKRNRKAMPLSARAMSGRERKAYGRK
jgi:uncharacterized DUF497 family protein